MNEEITVERTTDEAYIKSVFLNPTIYDAMRDDSCPVEPSALQQTAIMSVPGFFLRALIGGRPVGCWWLIWKGESVEAHTALLPECRGRDAVEATRKAIAWVFANTPARTITSYAWSDAPAVKWFCRAVGMHSTETRKWHATRHGKPVDISYYEIGRAV